MPGVPQVFLWVTGPATPVVACAVASLALLLMVAYSSREEVVADMN